ncbi:unnamed protein product, partial [Laminaria digitata]
EFSGVGDDGARIIGVELDVGLREERRESLLVYGLNEEVDLEYQVHERVSRAPQGVSEDEPLVVPPLFSTYTVSARVLARGEPAAAAAAAAAGETGGYSSITLRIAACGLSPADIMGRGASVFVEAAPAFVAGTGG